MVIRIEVEVKYKDGREEKYFPKYVVYGNNRVCFLLKENEQKVVLLDEVETIEISQDFRCE